MAADRRTSRGVPPSSSNPKRIESPQSLPGGWSERSDAARLDSRGRRQFSASERAELLASQEASGQSVARFARERGLKASTLHGWRRARTKSGSGVRRRRRRTRTYTPEQRRASVEAFLRSGRTRTEFAALWGVSLCTLSKWLKRYEDEGPQGLETRRVAGPGRPRTIEPAVRAEIVRTKRRFPSFGMRRVRDWLARFRGVRVSAGTVQKTLKEHDLANGPERPKAKRKPKPPRRFERARPMQLWQSDITSYLLTRHSRRVYLTVLLDDRSRYVVAWSLCSHQKSELVIDSLLEGIARFGKPEEVLTDQGRQYFSWRGKSGFQKLLDREGIRHVVSRTHHPQTLGKCERLWKTVGEEFWERSKPQDLAEARERLGHYFAHYNHFRPHQGIEGLVPADVFFGAQSALRETVEAPLCPDELQLALEESPRRSLYLFGQIGDRQVSLHGERGRVVVHTDGSELCSLGMDEMGIGQAQESDDERDEDRGNDGDEAAAAPSDHAQAHALHETAVPGDPGAGPVGAGERRGEGDGAPPVHGDPGILAGQEEQAGDGQAPGGECTTRVAALPAGAVGHAGGSLAPAAPACEGLAPSGGAGGGSQAAAAEHPGARDQARAHRGPGAGAEGPALDEGERGRERGEERCSPQADPQAPDESSQAPWGAGIPWK